MSTSDESERRFGRPPWEPVSGAPDGGYLFYYYSDDGSTLPIRAVTMPQNNKSDPNFETRTFGMFSICDESRRPGVVHHNRHYLLFSTRIGNDRFLTGYYRVGWFVPAWVLRYKSEQGRYAIRPDYYLGAKEAHFVAKPIPLDAVTRRLGMPSWRSRPRATPTLSKDEAHQMVNLIRERPNVIDDYVDEVRRLETINRSYHGTTYTNWKTTGSFDWEFAKAFLSHAQEKRPSEQDLAKLPSGTVVPHNFRCVKCKETIYTEARLKICHSCQRIGWMRPIFKEEIP